MITNSVYLIISIIIGYLKLLEGMIVEVSGYYWVIYKHFTNEEHN